MTPTAPTATDLTLKVIELIFTSVELLFNFGLSYLPHLFQQITDPVAMAIRQLLGG